MMSVPDPSSWSLISSVVIAHPSVLDRATGFPTTLIVTAHCNSCELSPFPVPVPVPMPKGNPSVSSRFGKDETA